MGNKTNKNIRDRIAFFGDVRTTADLECVIESMRPIVVDLDKLEKNFSFDKKAA